MTRLNAFSLVTIRRFLAAALLAIFTAAFFLPASAQKASFQGLGQMPGAMRGAGTYAQSMSADGSTIIGFAWVCPNGQKSCQSSGKTEAFGWTVKGKYRRLGDLGGPNGSSAFAASSDGLVIVGDASTNLDAGAFRWTAAQGMVALPNVMQDGFGVTSDGNVVVGDDHWWKITGKVGKFAPSPLTQAFAATGTMTAPIVVGDAGDHAFRWTAATGMQDIGSLSGNDTPALAISEDGKVVVGASIVLEGTCHGCYHAFRWTAATGMQDLGTLGGATSTAYAVNHDGSVVVGYSDTNPNSTPSADAFIWTANTGMQSLRAVLQAHGVHTADNWVFLGAGAGISADGTIITGWGRSPRTNEFRFGVDTPFRVVLPVR